MYFWNLYNFKSNELTTYGFFITLLESKCPAGTFQCKTGPQECLDYRLTCDAKFDCIDGSDEANCGPSHVPSCKPDQFRCANNKCIDNRKKCDGIPDCPSKEDELFCTGEFKNILSKNML